MISVVIGNKDELLDLTKIILYNVLDAGSNMHGLGLLNVMIALLRCETLTVLPYARRSEAIKSYENLAYGWTGRAKTKILNI